MRKPMLGALPSGVFRVKRWWYYQHRRGRPDHGPLIKLPEYGTSDFWTKLADIKGGNSGPVPHTVDALIATYKGHAKYLNLSEGSKETYGPALKYVSNRWGPLRTEGLTPKAIQAFLDEEFVGRPAMGNLTLSVLKTILKFGVPREYLSSNPAREIEELKEDRQSAKPWPEEIWEKIVKEAPVEIARLAVLGRATGQRISDLVDMRPRQRNEAGILTDIKKLSAKDHWCPLTPTYIEMIDGWQVFPHSTYLSDEKGRSFTPDALRRRLKRYVAGDPTLTTAGVMPHGLRSLAVCDRRIEGHTHQRISAAIGMSIRQVMSYSRHIDQRLAATGEREQNGPVKTPGPNVKTL